MRIIIKNCEITVSILFTLSILLFTNCPIILGNWVTKRKVKNKSKRKVERRARENFNKRISRFFLVCLNTIVSFVIKAKKIPIIFASPVARSSLCVS